MNTHWRALEFDKIIEQLQEVSVSEQVKERFQDLAPYPKEDTCIRAMAETTQARRILDACGTPPLPLMKGMEELLIQSEAGGMLLPEQLTETARFASSCRRMAAYLARGEAMNQAVAAYGRGLGDLTALQEEIVRCTGEDRVYDEASPYLREIRRQREHLEEQVKEKLAQVLRSQKQILADGYISKRGGRYVLPVQRRFQHQFSGSVVEVSGRGSTVFMEPAAVSKLQAEMDRLAVEEDGEVRRILYLLTGMVAEAAQVIRRNMEIMEELDFLFAKAKLSAAMKARAVEIGGERRLAICQGRHPLLKPESCVPLDFYMEEGTFGVVITGPNTGGKTVAVKTVGLLSMMAQCGLHIPCGEGTYIAMQDGYWCDIGDSQNIAQNLSTFSGHITNVVRILESASRDSLVLLDELGSGTDPAEGMGIAVAVLEELRRRGCQFLVTTHYAQVKTYACETEGILSARMAFDQETLRPLYRLELGKTGESCALQIAERLGMAPQLLDRAYREVYGESRTKAKAPEPMPVPESRLIRIAPKKEVRDPGNKFQMGDSVAVLPEEELGIVYRPADKNGDVIVQVKGRKQKIRHTRLQLKVPASELYPPDYDFSIIFDTVEDRKARKQMSKHHRPDLMITHEKEEWEQP